jgi:DNA-binding MarR family transcriptional regulator
VTHSGPDLALLLLAAYRKLVDQAVTEQERRGYGVVTPILHYALSAIAAGVTTATGLAQALAVSKQAAAKSIAVLSARGFVAVRMDPADNRRKRIEVTPLGSRVMEDGAAIFDQLRSEWASHAGSDRLQHLEETLRE